MLVINFEQACLSREFHVNHLTMSFRGHAHLPCSIYNLHIERLKLSSDFIFPKDVEIDRQPLCNSLGCFSKYVFPSLKQLCLNFGSVFTTHAYENIVKELEEKFEKPIDKQKVKNRIKTIKYNWSDCYDVFKNGLSGFAWSPITKMWSAEPEVWESLIQVCHLYSRSSRLFLFNSLFNY